MQFLRGRLQRLLVCLRGQTSSTPYHRMRIQQELRCAYRDFMRARKSSVGWQDIQAIDLDLIQQAESHL